MSIGATLMGGGNSAPIVGAFGKTSFEMFFNRTAVTSALDEKEQKVLGGTGSFARGAMRRQIRPGGKKGRKSDPEHPPRYHIRGFASLKDGIFFFFDLKAGSVIIGPNKLKTSVDPLGKASGAQLLEEGGRGSIVSYRHNKGRPATRKRRVGQWRKRPYVEPIEEPARAKMKQLIQTIPIR